MSIYGTANQPSSTGLSPTITKKMPDFDFLSKEYGNIGQIICPDWQAKEMTGTYPKYRIEDYFTGSIAERVTPGMSPPVASMEYSDETYNCHDVTEGVEWGLDVASRYASWYDVPKTHEGLLKRRIANRLESARINAAFNSANVGTTSTATAYWNNKATADPIADVDAMQASIFNKCGQHANTMVISYTTYLKLLRNQDLVNMTVAGGAGNPAVAENMQAPWLAKMLNIETVLISRAPTYVAGSGWSLTCPDNKALLFVSVKTDDITNPAQWMRRIWCDTFDDTTNEKKGKDAASHAQYSLYTDQSRFLKRLDARWWEEIKVINANAAGYITITA